ncbi:hypothetical protein MMC19_002630 [Ptychographa xylographoides]|nr:hypothetical protein [Ptychographa xylographoides]
MSGTSGSRLDQAVKGAAPPGTSVSTVSSRSASPLSASERIDENSSTSTGRAPAASDPLAILPSSPPQIYLNLLILEASLRSQYLTLRARRRQNTFFLLLLTLWTAYFFYALFLHPREDGSGIGGSVYWVIEMAEKVALMGGVVTGILIWGTGQWERGVRWPRRFVGVANRGLRTMNCKIVVIKGRWWKEILGHISFLFPYSLLFPVQGSSYHYIDASVEKRSHHLAKHGHHEDDGDLIREEDLAPGGDFIKVLLLPKPFSPDFRENWELYRNDYWEKENERRSQLLQRLRKQQRQKAREDGGWLWWTGWRGWTRVTGVGDVEKMHQRTHSEKDARRPHVRRESSHSRTTSRSSTPSNMDGDDRPTIAKTRRGSSSGSVSEGRRRSRAGLGIGSQQMSKLTPSDAKTGLSAVPGMRSPLTRGSSSLSLSSANDSDEVRQ